MELLAHVPIQTQARALEGGVWLCSGSGVGLVSSMGQIGKSNPSFTSTHMKSSLRLCTGRLTHYPDCSCAEYTTLTVCSTFLPHLMKVAIFCGWGGYLINEIFYFLASWLKWIPNESLVVAVGHSYFTKLLFDFITILFCRIILFSFAFVLSIKQYFVWGGDVSPASVTRSLTMEINMSVSKCMLYTMIHGLVLSF